MSTTHLALEAVQYALLAVVSVLVAVVVIATFIRIVKQPVPGPGELPTVTTTVSPADSLEAAAATALFGHWEVGPMQVPAIKR